MHSIEKEKNSWITFVLSKTAGKPYIYRNYIGYLFYDYRFPKIVFQYSRFPIDKLFGW